MKRRDFVKTLSATGVALYASDLVGDLIAQSPKARVMESRFKGLSDVALTEAKRLGCTYADIRFTRNVNDSVAVRDRIVTDSFGFGAGGMETSAGFGVRVIHSGVWGFASSPFVTEGEIKKITAQATEVAKASAVSKRFEVKLAPVEAYQDYWAVPVKQKPEDVSLDDKIALPDEDQRGRAQGARRDPRAVEHGVRLRVEVSGDLGRLVHRAGDLAHVAGLHRDRAQGRQVQVAHLLGGAEVGGLRSRARREDARERRAHRQRSGRALHRAAGRRRPQGSDHDAGARDADDPRDRRAPDRARSHRRLRSQLRRHELREGERRRQADDGLEAVQRDLRSHAAGRHVHRGLRR